MRNYTLNHNCCLTCAAVGPGEPRGTLAVVGAQGVDARGAVTAREPLTLVYVYTQQHAHGNQISKYNILIHIKQNVTGNCQNTQIDQQRSY